MNMQKVIVLVVLTTLASCARGQTGRFLPQGGNWALDTKTAQRCRLQGPTFVEQSRDHAEQNQRIDDLNRKAEAANEAVNKTFPNVPPLPLLQRLDPATPLCSEIVAADSAAEEHNVRVITTFIGTTLLALGGLYMTIRHWRKTRERMTSTAAQKGAAPGAAA